MTDNHDSSANPGASGTAMKEDFVMAIIGLAGVAVFLGIIVWRVPQIPLIIVFTVVFLMAAFDFWRELRSGRQNGG